MSKATQTLTAPSSDAGIATQSQPGTITHSRTKEGCWTCRIRQKKCDLEKGPNDECATCTRLKLKCRGWGANRPEWMKDKALVKQAREEIKQQLLAQGMVRGITRSSITSSSYPHSSYSARHPYERDTQGESSRPLASIPLFPVPSDSPTGTGSWPSLNTETSLPQREQSNSLDTPLAYPAEQPQNQGHRVGEHSIYPVGEGSKGIGVHAAESPLEINTDTVPEPTGGYDLLFNSLSIDGVPNPIELDMPFSPNDVSALTDYPMVSAVATSYNTAVPKNAEWDVYFPRLIAPTQPSQRSAPQEDLIFFYFSRVLPRQFMFEEKEAVNSMVCLLQNDPSGVLSDSLCILSAFLDSRIRAAEGLSDLFETRTHNSYTMYQRRVEQRIRLSRESGNHFTLAEAAACLHMASWWIFKGGSARWTDLLAVPLAWFEQRSGAVAHDFPIVAIRQLSPTEKFVMSCTIWLDIYSSITYMRTPHFLSLYRAMLHALVCYGRSDDTPLLTGTNGSCDLTMFTLAEIVGLECWKHEQSAIGALEPRELFLRHQQITFTLRSATITLTQKMDAAGVDPEQVTFDRTNDVVSDKECSVLAANVQLQTAYLYLSIVMHGYDSNVLENRVAMTATMGALLKMPPSAVDRLLVLPIFLVGCLTDDPLQRSYLADRLHAQRAPIGNTEEVLKLMQAVWSRRDETREVVDWRGVMGDLGMELLLI